HHNAYVVSVFGTFDFREKIAAIELRRIGTQDNSVGTEGEDGPHSPLIIGRNLVSRIAQSCSDVLPETIVRLHYQDSLCFVVHGRFLGWCQTVTGFNSGGVGVRGSWASDGLWLGGGQVTLRNARLCATVSETSKVRERCPVGFTGFPALCSFSRYS